MRFPKKFIFAAALLILLALAIPVEHKYDKLFRYFSLSLIPNGLEIPSSYDKKIYFYGSDLIAIALLFCLRIPLRRFFLDRSAIFLWIIFFCALISIAASPFAHYPLPYIRLLQLLTPILLFSFIANAFSSEEKQTMTQWILGAIVLGALFQTTVAIGQYFQQASLGLRILGEPQFTNADITFPGFSVSEGSRWIFDTIFHRVSANAYLIRATGTLPHPNVLGGFLALSLLAIYPLILRFEKFRPYLYLSFPFQFFALAITYSRAALFAWALGTFVWFVACRWRQKAFFKERVIRHLSFTIFFSATLTLVLLHDQYLHRGGVLNYNKVSEQSDTIRIQCQNIAFEMIKKNPLFGVGYNQFSERLPNYIPTDFNVQIKPTGTHNIYLFLASECGLISLAAFLLFIGTLLRASIRSSINPTTASLLAIFIAFLFIGVCDFYPILFQQGKLMLFCVAGLLAAHANYEKKSVPKALETAT